MPKYTFPDDGSAQHLAGVVVETSEENADRIPGLSGGTAKAEKKAPATSSTSTKRTTKKDTKDAGDDADT